jgi:hypothetical protein
MSLTKGESIMPVITLIAYMENGDSYVMNCRTDSWNSRFEMFITEDIVEAKDWLSDRMFEERKLPGGHNGEYEYTILIDGVDENYEGIINKKLRDGIFEDAYKLRNEKLEKFEQDKKEQAERANQEALRKAKLAEYNKHLDEVNRFQETLLRIKELEQELEINK